MTSMQYVKKMVLIPYDEYNSWKETKKLEINPTHQSESHLPESELNITKKHQSHNLQHETGGTEEVHKVPGFEAVPDKTHKELVSKIGSTLLDLLVSKGAKSLQNFIGAGENQVAPPPGEPDAKKPRRELIEEAPSSGTDSRKQTSASAVFPKVERAKTQETEFPKTGSKAKVTWKALR